MPEGRRDSGVPDASIDALPPASEASILPPSAALDASFDAIAPDAPPADAGRPEPYDIVTGRYWPQSVASDGEFVYWIDQGPIPPGLEPPLAPGQPGDTVNAMVLKCPVTGCEGAPTILASDQGIAGGISVRDGVVYWARSGAGEVVKCAASGCNGAPTPLATAQSNPFRVAVGATDVFWTNWGTTTQGSVMRCPLPDCSGGPVVVASGQPMPYGLAVDGTSVFWANIGWGVLPITNGSVAVCGNVAAGCGSTPTVLVELPELNARHVAVNATTVFWTNYDPSMDQRDGRVYACPRSGCNGAPVIVAAGQAEPDAIALDGEFVYWTNYPANLEAAGANVDSVLRCPVSGCGSGPEVMAKAQNAPLGLAVDANRIYWASGAGGSIVGMRK